MTRKNKRDQPVQADANQPEIAESETEQEPQPVPKSLIALFVFTLLLLGVVSTVFNIHPKERFPEQWHYEGNDGTKEDLTAPPADF